MPTNAIVAKLRAAAGAGRDALHADVAGGLAAVREGLGRVDRERKRPERLPVPLAEAEARIDAHVDRLAAEYRPQAHVFAAAEGPGAAGVVLQPHGQDVAMIAALATEALKAKLKADVAAYLNGQETIATADRRARLAALAAERRQLELTEEAIVRHAEALGLDVERRQDATPSVVLMPAAALEVAIGTAA